jgi:hypothetical protein
MTYSFEKAKEMIPLYVSGTLSEEEKVKVKNALAAYPDLTREVKGFSEIQQAFTMLEDELTFPDDRLFDQILNRIEKTEKVSPRIEASDFLIRCRRRWDALVESMQLSWAIVVIQACVILFLVFQAVPTEHQQYQTLSSDPVKGAMESQINIVFHPDTAIQDILACLKQIDATVINGPDARGLFVIGVSEKESTKTLLFLKQSKIVRFASISITGQPIAPNQMNPAP